jgi:16S rRNA G966 N2-methylase RsmD
MKPAGECAIIKAINGSATNLSKEIMTPHELANFDYAQLDSPDFKEDSVREVVVLPLIQSLGYDNSQIVRSKALAHPFLKVGSKKRPVNLVPDYLFRLGDSFAWVLDAKAPHEAILQGDNVEQVYSYAIHPEIRSKYFALCNGKEFSLFRQDATEALLYFELRDIDLYWEKLEQYLAPSSFQTGKSFTYPKAKQATGLRDFDYLNRPLLDEIPVRKRAVKRHFGVHGYFTKQTWNVVQEYIRNFSQAGDLVLDPFGGTGITAVEAMMCDRRAIHVDLNPMSVFMVGALVAPVKINALQLGFQRIAAQYEKNEPRTDDEIAAALAKYSYPQGVALPSGSDVEVIEDLFSRKQLAQLAYLRHLINREPDPDIKLSLLLAFSSTVNKINLTYHHSTYASENAGDSAPMRYYRYRIAPENVDLSVLATYTKKFSAVVNAKREIAPKINAATIDRLQIVKGTATDLDFVKSESVDYIYTDPPYGKKIPYLDLSVMWNSWLGLKVTEEDYQQEAIEGGEHEKSKAEYNRLIAQSIEEMYRVLKFDRWMSFVFAHKDPEFWHLIIDTAEKCGFEYAGAVPQKNGQTSFKKRQHPFTVLSGQLIINFRKVRKPKAIMKASLGMNISEIVWQTIEGLIAKNHGATLEQINDELIIKGLELGFLDLLKQKYSDLAPLLLDAFDYDDKTELFTIRHNAKFRTHVDVKLRVRYYLISYLRRMGLQKQAAHFDEIVLHIMPLLKNGVTPEEQTILGILEEIAERVGEDSWRLKGSPQIELFAK